MLSIQLLNTFSLAIRSDDVAVPTSISPTFIRSLNSPRLQALLAYMLLHRQEPQPRGQVAYLLWPDAAEERARANLRSLFHLLRRALPQLDQYLWSDTQTIQWQASRPYELDVELFEQALGTARRRLETSLKGEAIHDLEQAVELYRGDLLPGCYSDWILPERERLRQLYLQALERLIVLQEGQRDYRKAIYFAQMLLFTDPLQEATHRRLMWLYALDGDRAGAWRAYHYCVGLLRRELDIQPSPATQELHDQLMHMDVALVDPGRAMVDLNTPALPSGELPLVGRNTEWGRLQEACKEAFQGRATFVLLSGEVGLGKTRLLEELHQWAARQGLPVACAVCSSLEVDLPYSPLTSWLRARSLPALEPAWLAEIARLLPELLVQRADLPHPTQLVESWQRQSLHLAVTHALLPAGRLLLLLDDMQWCDSQTLQWLLFLFRQHPSAPLVVVGTASPEETLAGSSLVDFWQELERAGRFKRIDLVPLDEQHSFELSRSLLDLTQAPDLEQRVYSETGGNPYILVEMARFWSNQGSQAFSSPVGGLPEAIHTFSQRKLRHLSSTAGELLGLASVFARPFTYTELCRASRQPESAIVEALDELCQRRILQETCTELCTNMSTESGIEVSSEPGSGAGDQTYDFTYLKLRQVAYAELSTARRQYYQHCIAQAN